jgi:hypothetical protein
MRAVIIFLLVAIVGFAGLGIFLYIRIRKRNQLKELRSTLIPTSQQSLYEEEEDDHNELSNK